jgi:hypothetical protein
LPPIQRSIVVHPRGWDSRALTDVCDAPVWRRATYRVPSRVPKNPRVERALEPLVRTKSRMSLGTSAVPLSRFRVIGSHPLRPNGLRSRFRVAGSSTAIRRSLPTRPPRPSRDSHWESCVTHISMSEVSVAELAPARWFHGRFRLSSSPTPPYASRLLHPTPRSEERRHEEWKHPLDQGPSFTILTWLALVPTSLVVFWCARSQAPPTLDVHRTFAHARGPSALCGARWKTSHAPTSCPQHEC